MYEFKYFKEISIGGLTREGLISRLTEKDFKFNKYAEMLFEHPSFSPGNDVEKVKLVKVTLADLQMANPCSFSEITQKASNLGLRTCPLYLAAFLRLQYMDQPEGPYLTIASVQPENGDDYPNGFYIRNFDSSLWLRGYLASGACEWPMENSFIFLK